MEATSYWPFWLLLIGIASVVLQIAVFRIHAFLALVLSAILVGLLNPSEESSLVGAVELTMQKMGSVAGSIAFVIALASILGVALTKSGAAEKIVLKFLSVFGEKFAALALLLAGFILSIPVFFDTVFFLMIPIAYSMGKRFQSHYVFYVMAIAIGGVLTHCLVPPTPGPVIMAETMSINLGIAILAGALACTLPAAITYFVSKRISSNMEVKVPDMGDEPESDEKNLPSFLVAILPIVIPILLIVGASSMDFLKLGNETGWFKTTIEFAGNKNIAMLVGTCLALWILSKQKGLSLSQIGKEFEKPLEIAGVIILITSAGGAFGAMIKETGISGVIEDLSNQGVTINLVLLGWVISSVLKFAQGSGTVAMITTSGIMVALIQSVDLAYHPIYIYLAIGFGSMTCSWMNDSAFWVVSKMSGFTQGQMLRTWTVTLAVMSVLGMAQALLLSWFLPLV